jgi:hypothetical protein
MHAPYGPSRSYRWRQTLTSRCSIAAIGAHAGRPVPPLQLEAVDAFGNTAAWVGERMSLSLAAQPQSLQASANDVSARLGVGANLVALTGRARAAET